jgi:phenylpyruvate tautomerase PptA (4-oxalocrotonate tautomerase family)
MPMIDVYATTGTFADKHARVQVLTPLGVLDRDKQVGVVKELTEIIAAAARDPGLVERTWVLLTESPEGGWRVAGHANIGADRGEAARAEMAAAAPQQGAGA